MMSIVSCKLLLLRDRTWMPLCICFVCVCPLHKAQLTHKPTEEDELQLWLTTQDVPSMPLAPWRLQEVRYYSPLSFYS